MKSREYSRFCCIFDLLKFHFRFQQRCDEAFKVYTLRALEWLRNWWTVERGWTSMTEGEIWKRNEQCQLSPLAQGIGGSFNELVWWPGVLTCENTRISKKIYVYCLSFAVRVRELFQHRAESKSAVGISQICSGFLFTGGISSEC